MTWNKEHVLANIPVYVPCTKEEISRILKDIDELANAFQDGAADGYLEGDSVMYEDKNLNSVYEFVLDNIQISLNIKRLYKPNANFTLFHQKYKPYWD